MTNLWTPRTPMPARLNGLVVVAVLLLTACETRRPGRPLPVEPSDRGGYSTQAQPGDSAWSSPPRLVRVRRQPSS